jgi:hypothetical protein
MGVGLWGGRLTADLWFMAQVTPGRTAREYDEQFMEQTRKKLSETSPD